MSSHSNSLHCLYQNWYIYFFFSLFSVFVYNLNVSSRNAELLFILLITHCTSNLQPRAIILGKDTDNSLLNELREIGWWLLNMESSHQVFGLPKLPLNGSNFWLVIRGQGFPEKLRPSGVLIGWDDSNGTCQIFFSSLVLSCTVL